MHSHIVFIHGGGDGNTAVLRRQLRDARRGTGDFAGQRSNQRQANIRRISLALFDASGGRAGEFRGVPRERLARMGRRRGGGRRG